jgi:DNA-binding SARP family transcriptional activator/TolB-like protein/Tfp pilus assembly protein PilF
MPQFDLRLLGGFELVDRSNGPLRVPPGRLRALLGRLAFDPGRSRSRGDLAALLWDGRPERTARHSLNQALSQLRGIAGSGLFVQDGDRLALAPERMACDLDEVRRLTRDGSPAALQRAGALCRGPFLDGIDLDAPEFEAWLRTARAEVDDLMVAVHEARLAATSVHGDPDRAVGIAETLTGIDPLNERGHCALIEAAKARGETTRALQIYETFRQRLGDELGVAPEQDTSRLIAGLRRPSGSGAAPGAPDPPASAATGRPTVFVAPFRPCGDAGHRHAVADGVTHDLITELARFRSLNVIAAESALACRDTSESLDALCRRFEADYVLTGTVRCASDAAWIDVELFEVRGAGHLWSDHYACALGELFEVRDDMIARLVGTAAGRVEHDRMRRARRPPTRSWAAYDYFLHALEIYYRRWSAPDAPQACKPLFEKAVELDPQFARGHAFLACVNAHMGQSERMGEDFETSIGYARHAMALDPLEADAPRVLGAIYTVLGHHEEGYRHLARAVRLNPGHADLAAHMSRYHTLNGDPGRALAEAERARRLNPLHPDWYWTLTAMAHHAAGNYAEAVAALARMRHTTAMEHLYAAAAHAAMGEAGRADAEIRRAVADMPDLTLDTAGLYLPYKDPDRRAQLLDQLARAGLPRAGARAVVCPAR